MTLGDVLKLDVGNFARGHLRKPAAEPKHYVNLDLLRLFLALEVVASHTWTEMRVPGPLWVLVSPVPCFVCLSGFLIPDSLARSRSVAHFAAKRFLRTIPALIPMLTFAWLWYGPIPVRDTLEGYATLGYVGQRTIAPLWSLGVEDALYALLVVLYIAGAYRSRRALWSVFACASLLFFVTVGLDQYRLWATSSAFFAGSLAWSYRTELRRLPMWMPLITLLVPLIPHPDFPELNVLLQPLACASALFIAMNAPQIRWKLPDVSYGVYIWHVAILFALTERLGRVSIVPVMIWPLAIGAATLSWYLVEKPALKLKNARFRWPGIATRTAPG